MCQGRNSHCNRRVAFSDCRLIGFTCILYRAVITILVPIPIVYDGIEFEEGYPADLIVERSIIVELKSVEALLPVHWKQLFTQLKLNNFRLGLLINFGA